ncbi:18108_t:CDS:2 [Racocetra fulgida]|uniref:18108_t:CDS:1 n=1 Tax=Racocetra fulgida TaxID=60492 RepID=A0A9N9BIQ3_9GLOM|nr:18108_t:CDS:2 [Racocetra fulgida]
MAQEKRTTKSKSKKSEYFLDNDEASSSSTVEKKLKSTITEDLKKKFIFKAHERRKTGEVQLEERSIIYTVDDIIQKTKKDNNELMSLLSDLNLIEVGKDEIVVNFEESKIINLPKLSENQFQNRFHIREGKLSFICRRNCVELFEKVIESIDENNESRDNLDEKLKLIETDHSAWVNNIPTLLKTFGLVIVSASANNEAYPNEFKSWEDYSICGGYNYEEFEEWCKMRNYKVNENPKIKSQLDFIRFWTNSYPLELDLWHKTDGYDLEEKTSNYLKKRGHEIKLSHQIFQKSLSPRELESLNECVISMIFKSTKPSMIFGMNRQFMYETCVFDKEEDENTKRDIITAIHPLAQQAIIDAHSNHPLNELRDFVSTVFNNRVFK